MNSSDKKGYLEWVQCAFIYNAFLKKEKGLSASLFPLKTEMFPRSVLAVTDQ